MFESALVVTSGEGRARLHGILDGLREAGVIGPMRTVDLAFDWQGACAAFTAEQSREFEMDEPGLYFWVAVDSNGDASRDLFLYVGKATASVSTRHAQRVAGDPGQAVLSMGCELAQLYGCTIQLRWVPTRWSAMLEMYILTVLLFPANYGDQDVPWGFHALHDPAVIEDAVRRIYHAPNTADGLAEAKAAAVAAVPALFKGWVEFPTSGDAEDVLRAGDDLVTAINGLDAAAREMLGEDRVADLLAIRRRLMSLRARHYDPTAWEAWAKEVAACTTRAAVRRCMVRLLLEAPPHDLNKLDGDAQLALARKLVGEGNSILGRA